MKVSAQSISGTTISLMGFLPSLNGQTYENVQWREETLGTFIHLSCTIESIEFHLQLLEVGTNRAQIRYWLKNLPADFPLYRFGISFQKISNLRAFLRSGYFSWDGSYYLEPEQIEQDLGRHEIGYAMTQLLPRSGKESLVIGFEQHERFQRTFRLNQHTSPYGLNIETLWDCATTSENQTSPETLILLEHEQVEEGLREWAQHIASTALIPPRLACPAIIGWASWYNLYAAITEENILDHLHATARVTKQENLPMSIFQIDDGFTPEMGDWLEIKPQFPRGMKALLDDIRTQDFVPGLWIAPFMVGNRSKLYAQHPDWVVKERKTGKPFAQMRFYGEFRWHKRSEEYYILDTTHPDAFAYLRQVFRTWRQEWGCEYFKTDFMHFMTEHGAETLSYYQSGFSRIEIWRHTVEMIREELGDAIWLGCGFPLWAGIGLVDAIRIGRDVGVEWAGNHSAQSLLRDQASRNFANHILWQADPDCILIRENYHHLTENELRSLAIYAGMSGGLIMTSDKLDELSPERLRLWKLLLNPEKSLCHYPLLGQSPLQSRLDDQGKLENIAHEPVLVQLRESLTNKDVQALFVLNSGDNTVERHYRFADLGITGARYIYNWISQRTSEKPETELHLELKAHDGILLFLSKKPFESYQHHLP